MNAITRINGPSENSLPGSPGLPAACLPEALNIAISQIAEALKGSGVEKARELAASPEGYLKLLWMLEKLSKASLDWREVEEKSLQKRKEPGISPETERELERIFEGADDDDLLPPSPVSPSLPLPTFSPDADSPPGHPRHLHPIITRNLSAPESHPPPPSSLPRETAGAPSPGHRPHHLSHTQLPNRPVVRADHPDSEEKRRHHIATSRGREDWHERRIASGATQEQPPHENPVPL